jgi:oligosaccharide repeat unit polymerase
MNKISNIKYLFFIPSFYGFLTMTFTYTIFILNVIEYNPISFQTHFIVILSILSFFTSSFLTYILNKKFFKNYTISNVKINRGLLISLYAVSFFGVFMYLKEYFSFYGGYINYFLILFSDNSSELRANSLIASESIGIQFTYFGWIAIGLNVIQILNKKLSKIWYILIILTFICNLLFIDRTRPMWILLIILYLLFCLNIKKIKFASLLKKVILFLFAFFFIFISIGSLAGKTTEEKLYEGWNISPNVQNIVFYLTSSYFYLDYIICNENPVYEFDRTINPVLKTFKSIGIIEKEPSSLINEFYGQPYKTNVGTFLEPFYRDFGYLYMIFGIILHSVFLNYFAIFFLKMNSPYSLFLVSNICIIDFFAFFTPKLNNFPIWLFFSIGFLIVLKKIFLKIFKNV